MPPSRSPLLLLIVVAALAGGVVSTAGTAGGPVHALAAASSPVVATAPPDPVPATAPPAPTPQATGPIVALGDSLTYGYGAGVTMAAYGPAPAHSYPWDMARDLGIPVVNAGVSGTTAYEVLNPASEPEPRPVSLQLPALLALHPRLMVVGFGTNEETRGWPISRTVAAFQQLLDRIAAAHVPIVLVGTHADCTLCLPPQPPYAADWDAALTALATQYHAGLVLDVERGFTAADMTDWIHCDAQGYRLMATRIEAAVRARLG